MEAGGISSRDELLEAAVDFFFRGKRFPPQASVQGQPRPEMPCVAHIKPFRGFRLIRVVARALLNAGHKALHKARQGVPRKRIVEVEGRIQEVRISSYAPVSLVVAAKLNGVFA